MATLPFWEAELEKWRRRAAAGSGVTGQLKTSQPVSNQSQPLRGEEFMPFRLF
jgi:hypothetical protein